MVSPSDRRGFQTSVWGPAAWVFLHTITFSYPDKPTPEMKRTFKKFFKSLCHILPCIYCRQSYTKYSNSKESPMRLTNDVFKSRSTLTRWLYKIHEAVNERLEKTDRPTYDSVKTMYDCFEARCNTHNTKEQHGCIVPVKNYKKLRTVIRIVPRSCKLRGGTLKIYRACKNI